MPHRRYSGWRGYLTWPSKLLLFGLVVLLWATSLAVAENNPADEPALWESTAKRAESVITQGQAAMPELEKLRADLAGQRAGMLKKIQQGNIETRTLQAQLELLGPPPPEGQTEAAALAATRLKLMNAIAAADAPLLAARQAHRRADILIAELNKLIRRALTAQWLERNPSPLHPSGWVAAAVELPDYLAMSIRTLRQIYGSPAGQALLRQQGPLAAGCLLLAAAIAIILRPWLWRRLDSGLSGEYSRSQQWLHTARAIFLRLLVPAAAAVLIAVSLTLLLSISIIPNAPAIKSVTTVFLLFLVSASWLGQLLFAPTAPEDRKSVV